MKSEEQLVAVVLKSPDYLVWDGLCHPRVTIDHGFT